MSRNNLKNNAYFLCILVQDLFINLEQGILSATRLVVTAMAALMAAMMTTLVAAMTTATLVAAMTAMMTTLVTAMMTTLMAAMAAMMVASTSLDLFQVLVGQVDEVNELIGKFHDIVLSV
jgi:hypothetical protein